MSKRKKAFEIIGLIFLTLVVLYTVFLWKYVLPYVETEEPEVPAESTEPTEPAEPEIPADDLLPGGDHFQGEPEVTV